jgi:CheY-like chemotaxis protein
MGRESGNGGSSARFVSTGAKARQRTATSVSRTNRRALNVAQNTVLVIDDDQDICNAICAVLEGAGFSTATAANGKEGLAMLSGLEPRPSLVLLDLWMPEMSGWDFHDRVSHDRELRCIPIIIMTVYGREDAPGSLKWLRKPIDVETLLEAVHASCSTPVKRQQRR